MNQQQEELQKKEELQNELAKYDIHFDDAWWEDYWMWIQVSRRRSHVEIPTYKSHKKEIEQFEKATSKYKKELKEFSFFSKILICNSDNEQENYPDGELLERIYEIEEDINWLHDKVTKALQGEFPSQRGRPKEKNIRDQIYKCIILWEKITDSKPTVTYSDYKEGYYGPFLLFVQKTLDFVGITYQNVDSLGKLILTVRSEIYGTSK